jgi:hypothetical protein
MFWRQTAWRLNAREANKGRNMTIVILNKVNRRGHLISTARGYARGKLDLFMGFSQGSGFQDEEAPNEEAPRPFAVDLFRTLARVFTTAP